MARALTILFLVSAACARPADAPIPQITVDQGSGAPDVAAADATTTSDDVAAARDLAEPDLAAPPELLGEVWNTYYWLAPEVEHPGAKTVELLDVACEPIATVSEDYADALCIEGSGLLEDGRVVNYAQRCDCGRPCSSGSTICWSSLDPAQFPWGQGAFGNALEPLRSLAVDPDFVPLRTAIWIEEFDGLDVPALGGVGAFTHDGCFRADDIGGAIDGNHIDIFAGSTPMWRHMESVFPTRSTLHAYTGVTKCEQ